MKPTGLRAAVTGIFRSPPNPTIFYDWSCRNGITWMSLSSSHLPPGEIQGEICAPDSLEKPQLFGILEYNLLSTGWVWCTTYGSSVALTLTLSASSTMRTAAFRDWIRSQDCRCVVTIQLSLSEKWSMAWLRSRSYLFLALEHIFISQGYFPACHRSWWNKSQNGILLCFDIHQWDDYSISVNPHDGYKAYAFLGNGWLYHGSILRPVWGFCRCSWCSPTMATWTDCAM